jgi:hypothetical protein
MVDLASLPDPVLLAKLRLWKYSIRSESKFMLATFYKAKSNIGTIRGVNLVAVKLTTFHFTKMPLVQTARPLYARGRWTVALIEYEGWWVPEPVEMLWIRNKFLIPAGTHPLYLPASNLLNIVRVLISRNFVNTNCNKAGRSVHKSCLQHSFSQSLNVCSVNF